MLDFPPQEIDYPTSDGQPMGETDLHRDQMMDLISTLEVHFEEVHDTYVSGNILLYYVEGNPRKHISPDVLVVHGIPKVKRETYRVWDEGKAPDLVIEVTSKSTRAEDLGDKKGLYAFLGVQEYVLFDPRKEYLQPRLRFYRLVGEEYTRVAGRLVSETTGLEFRVVDEQLRLFEIETGRMLPTPRERAVEAEKKANESERKADEAEKRALEAETRVEQLAAELAQLRRQLEKEK